MARSDQPVTAPERVPFAGGLAPDVHAWNRFHARTLLHPLEAGSPGGEEK